MDIVCCHYVIATDRENTEFHRRLWKISLKDIMSGVFHAVKFAAKDFIYRV